MVTGPGKFPYSFWQKQGIRLDSSGVGGIRTHDRLLHRYAISNRVEHAFYTRCGIAPIGPVTS